MKTIISLLLISILFACNSGVSYQEFETVSSDLIWKKEQAIQFELDYKKSDKNDEVWVMARHTIHYAFNNIPIIIDIKGPNGFEKRSIANIPVRDESGLILGSAMGDIVDLEYKSDISLKDDGKYEFTYTVGTEQDLLDVMEVGLMLKAK